MSSASAPELSATIHAIRCPKSLSGKVAVSIEADSHHLESAQLVAAEELKLDWEVMLQPQISNPSVVVRLMKHGFLGTSVLGEASVVLGRQAVHMRMVQFGLPGGRKAKSFLGSVQLSISWSGAESGGEVDAAARIQALARGRRTRAAPQPEDRAAAAARQAEAASVGLEKRRLASQLAEAEIDPAPVGGRPPLRAVFIGPPAAGKGTQCALLAAQYSLVHISIDEVLRQAAKEGTHAGRLAARYAERGEAPPDGLMVDALAERLRKRDCAEL